MITKVARGLDYCGNFLGAGKENIISPEMPSRDIRCTAYADVGRNYHFRAWKNEKDISKSSQDYIDILRAVAAQRVSSFYADCARAFLEEM